MFVDIYLLTSRDFRTNFGYAHLTRLLTRKACEIDRAIAL